MTYVVLPLRLNKRDLAKKLGVSERALTSWQREGMPVLEHGRRGQVNAYDLAAVVRWIKHTGRGLELRGGRDPVDIEKLERELGAPVARADVCTSAQARAIARAVMLARVEHIGGAAQWDFEELSPRDVADVLDLFIYRVAEQLAAAGLQEASCLLQNCQQDETAWPEAIDEIVQRCLAEVPR